MLVFHQAISPSQILVIEFSDHEIRREFVNRLVRISPSERILYLQKIQLNEKEVSSYFVERSRSPGSSKSPEDITEIEEGAED